MNLLGRVPLRDGTKLICDTKEIYTICGEIIGAGGYSIVYSAKKEGENSLLAIKECYPLNKPYQKAAFYREEGVVTVTSEGEEYLEELSLQLQREKEYSQSIFNYSLCVVKMQKQLSVKYILMDGQCLSGEKGIFFLMDDIRMKSISLHDLLDECRRKSAPGYAFRCGGLPAINTTARILSEILNSVIKIHTLRHGCWEGYLHGDLQENNIFFQNADMKEGKLGIACLLDLGCMKPVGQDGCTDWVNTNTLCGTPGYIPPEMIFGDDKIRLGVQADIYSLGRLFLYMLTGKQYLERGRDRIYYDATLRKISPAEGERIGCKSKVRLYVNEILSKALAFEPTERYGSAFLMKQDMDKLCEMTAVPKYSLPDNLSGASAFTGRESELQKIDELFEREQGSSPVWLYGAKGVGKTQLAVQYGIMVKNRDERPVYRIVFRKSLLETIASVRFIGDDTENTDDKMLFRHNLDLMEEYFGDALFIIDGIEIGKGKINVFLRSKAYQEIIRRSFRLLFATRYDLGYLGLCAFKVGS